MWGACFDQGQPHTGAGEGPRLLREAGLLECLAQHGLDVEDHGDEGRERGQEDTKETRQRAVGQFSRVVHDKELHTFTQRPSTLEMPFICLTAHCRVQLSKVMWEGGEDPGAGQAGAHSGRRSQCGSGQSGGQSGPL